MKSARGIAQSPHAAARRCNQPWGARHPDPQQQAHEILDQGRRLHGIPTWFTACQELKSPSRKIGKMVPKRCPVPERGRKRDVVDLIDFSLTRCTPKSTTAPRGPWVPKGPSGSDTKEFAGRHRRPPLGQPPGNHVQPGTTLPLIGGQSQGGKIAVSAQQSALSDVNTASSLDSRAGVTVWDASPTDAPQW